MRDGPRWQAVIELLDQVLVQRVPADLALKRWGRGARYAGSRDRRFIADNLYGVCRHLAALDWRLEAAGMTEAPDARQRMLAWLVQSDPGAAIEAPFDGSDHAPAVLSEAERGLLARLCELPDHAMPDAARLNVPAWALPGLQASFGDDWRLEAAGLAGSPPVDLRLCRPTGPRETFIETLNQRWLTAAATPYAPRGIRLSSRFAPADLPELQQGSVELQDEASQLVSLLVGAKPGEAVLDACAGAGGKTLVLAEAMAGQGELLALDLDSHRIAEAEKRLLRAGHDGVRCLQVDLLASQGAEWDAPRWDRVLLDAPCTGTGTWRRAPDARWRMDAERLDSLCEIQGSLLARAAGLVKPGGWLVYVTCSLLADENDSQIAAFLARHGDFSSLDFAQVWQAAGMTVPPPAAVIRPAGWLLTPARHGTDGFYMAVLARSV